VAPGPLPVHARPLRRSYFPRTASSHIADKHALMAEVFPRGSIPGGRFIASDWLISHDHAPRRKWSPICSEGLSSAWPRRRYREAMQTRILECRPTAATLVPRGAKLELERLRGPLGAAAARIVGQDFVDHYILIWSRIDSGAGERRALSDPCMRAVRRQFSLSAGPRRATPTSRCALNSGAGAVGPVLALCPTRMAASVPNAAGPGHKRQLWSSIDDGLAA